MGSRYSKIKAKQKYLIHRKQFARSFLTHVKNGIEIIFTDETGFNNDMKPLYGYSKVDEKCCAKKANNSENYTVISAITMTK